MSLRRLVAAFTLILIPSALLAKSFVDVPSTSLHEKAINELSEKGVITGNPDGTFKPGNPLNRAALLALAYRAAGKTPGAASKDCFKDKLDEWYAAFACDAKEKGYIQGYQDGTFGGGRTVTIAEATKIALTVMELPVAGVTLQDVRDINLLDVSVDAWFSTYVIAAYKFGVLPLPSQDPTRLYPNDPLSRAQAASLIYQAWKAKQNPPPPAQELPPAPPPPPEQAPPPPPPPPQAGADASVSSKAVLPKPSILHVLFPFDDRRRFDAKAAVSYRFSLKSATAGDFSLGVKEGNEGGVRCILYRLDEDGFSTEYYLGIVDGRSCRILAYLAPGSYQMDVQPTKAAIEFIIAAKTGKSDGNDGFSQAKTLEKNVLRSGEFLADTDDLWDFFVFTVKGDPETQQPLFLETLSKTALSCQIFPDKGVDVYTEKSSEGQPHCNEEMILFPGKYFVSIGHGPLHRYTKQTYAIQVRDVKKP